MIYLIGGPPRVGKTILAQTFSRTHRVPWISCDTLETIAGEYMSQSTWNRTHPYSVARRKLSHAQFYDQLSSVKIVALLRAQARATFAAISMLVECSLQDGVDYCIEGYHIEPTTVEKLQKKFGAKHIRAVFLVKHDVAQFVRDVSVHSGPNDWLKLVDKKGVTFECVGKMVAHHSATTAKEAASRGYAVVSMDKQFGKAQKEAMRTLYK